MVTGRRALGDRAEQVVADYLVARGFALIARNLRLGRLELDLVARRNELVVIVEVRTRGTGSFTGPLASVGPTKRRHLVRAAEWLWRDRLRGDPSVARVRIDVAGVSFGPRGASVDYVTGAITAA